MSDTHPDKAEKMDSQLKFHFIKGEYFRVVHASGAWHSFDNQNNVHLTFYNERYPLPQSVVVNLDKEGFIIGEDFSKRETKEGWVRELEVDIVLSENALELLHKTIGDNLRIIKESRNVKSAGIQ